MYINSNCNCVLFTPKSHHLQVERSRSMQSVKWLCKIWCRMGFEPAIFRLKVGGLTPLPVHSSLCDRIVNVSSGAMETVLAILPFLSLYVNLQLIFWWTKVRILQNINPMVKVSHLSFKNVWERNIFPACCFVYSRVSMTWQNPWSMCIKMCKP